MITIAQRIWDEMSEGWTLTTKQVAKRLNLGIRSVSSALTGMKGAGLVEVVEVIPKVEGTRSKPQNRYRVTRGLGKEWKDVWSMYRDYVRKYAKLHPYMGKKHRREKPVEAETKQEQPEPYIPYVLGGAVKVGKEQPMTKMKVGEAKTLLEFDLEGEMKSLMEKFIRIIGTTPRNMPMSKIKLAFSKALTYYGA